MAPITTTDINRSADDVFAYATDPTRFNEWQSAWSTCIWTGRAPPQVGAECMNTRRIGGANRPSTSRLATSTHQENGGRKERTDRFGPPLLTVEPLADDVLKSVIAKAIGIILSRTGITSGLGVQPVSDSKKTSRVSAVAESTSVLGRLADLLLHTLSVGDNVYAWGGALL